MKEDKRKNLLLVSAFSLPVILIVSVVLGMYAFSGSVSTEYNFVYSICDDLRSNYGRGCSQYVNTKYYIDNNKFRDDGYYNNLVAEEDKLDVPPNPRDYKISFFLYDAENNKSRTLAEKELYSLSFVEGIASPEGVYVSRERKSEVFGSSSYGYYLKKEGNYKKINIINISNGFYDDRFEFIGWVLPGNV